MTASDHPPQTIAPVHPPQTIAPVHPPQTIAPVAPASTARLAGETAVVVGAAGGIGAEICRVFLREGAVVAAVDSDAGGVAALAEQFGVEGFTLDVTSDDGPSVLALQAEQSIGLPTVLVSTIGLWHTAEYQDVSQAAWAQVIDVNLTAVFRLCQAFLPGMCEAGRGSVINFASTAGEYGSIRPAAHYAAAKGGLIAMSKSLAREAAPHRVRVNVISPGPVETAMHGPLNDEQREAIADRTLLGRMGTPHDIAEAAVYLAAPESAWVTGQVLRVNGGALI